jgi:hypothetical protein
VVVVKPDMFANIFGIGARDDSYNPVSPNYPSASLCVVAIARMIEEDDSSSVNHYLYMTIGRSVFYEINADVLLDAKTLCTLDTEYDSVLHECRNYAYDLDNWRFVDFNWRQSSVAVELEYEAWINRSRPGR